MTSIANQMYQTLADRLTPSHLEALDESAAHAGHAGANGTGSGPALRARGSRHLSSQDAPAWPNTALCMMRCKNY